MGKKVAENSKKVAGNARKAEAAASKAAAEDAKRAAAEDAEWSKGAKGNAKKEAEAAKKADAARKKAERDAMLADEEKNAPSKPKSTSKGAAKKTSAPSRGLDLSQLDEPAGGKGSALNASGIDNALDALSLASGAQDKIDRHPERRFKAAYAAFEERRLAEMDADGSGAGLRLNQRKDKIRKEFEKSDENPFNQVNAQYNTTRDEMKNIREGERIKTESRLR